MIVSEFIAKIIVLGVIGLILLSMLWNIYKSNMFGNRKLVKRVLHPKPSRWSNENVTVSWLGHATVLLNIFGKKMIIDPALEERIGVTPFSGLTIGPKRFLPPALSVDEVGEVDIILITHAHTDHFDYPTIRKLQSSNTIIIVARHMAKFLEGMNFKKVIEIDWEEKINVEGIEIRGLEGRHWGARLPWHKDYEANSYLISKNGVNMFFGGDTAYTQNFANKLREIPIDIAFVGIGAYSPKPFESKHATPEQGWKMAREIGAKWVIPMHWGAFKLSRESMEEPIKRFRAAAISKIDMVPIWEVGETFVLPKN